MINNSVPGYRAFYGIQDGSSVDLSIFILNSYITIT